ncbi:MAG: ADOP family duplicated permease [Terriglobales bacterium]
MAQDLRFAFRMLWRRPGLTMVAMITLALGIGAATSMFSVVQRVILEPLPFSRPRQLVMIHEQLKRSGNLNVSWPDYLDWRRQTHSFSSLAAIGFGGTTAYKTPAGATGTLDGANVTASLFPVLGAHFVLGRDFTAQEDSAAGTPALIVTSRFWKTALGANPHVIGSVLKIQGASAPIVGVVRMNARDMPWTADAYTALGTEAEPGSAFVSRGNHPGLQVLARVKPGVTLAAARTDLGLVMQRLAAAYPRTNQDEGVVMLRLSAFLNARYRSELWLLLAAVGLVLLLACANLAHLLLAGASARSREYAIRCAVGASRGDLLRQSASETLVLAALGGGLGVLLAWAITPLLVHWAPYPVPRMQQTHLDAAVVAFAVAAAAVAALLMGLAPALAAARTDLSQRVQPASQRGLRSGLLVAEVALAVIVVGGAGLLARSLQEVLAVNPGFNMRGLVTLYISHDPGGALSAFQNALSRVRALPGVAAAGAIHSAPLHGFDWTTPYMVGGEPAPPTAERPWSELNFVLPGYFRMLGAHGEAGRFFNSADGVHAPLVALVNQTLARKLAPGGSAVGKRVFVADDGQWRQVVGVIGDIPQNSLSAPAYPEIILPLAQFANGGVGSAALVVRAAGNPGIVSKELARAIPTINSPELMSTALSNTLVRRNFLVELMAGFGLLALLLATLGIYAVTSQRVIQQTRDMGVRLALGASPVAVARSVLGASLRSTALGLAIGLAGAYTAGRLWAHWLFGVGPADPVTLAGTCALLVGVAVVASLRPAWRAARVDPAQTLRAE